MEFHTQSLKTAFTFLVVKTLNSFQEYLTRNTWCGCWTRLFSVFRYLQITTGLMVVGEKPDTRSGAVYFVLAQMHRCSFSSEPQTQQFSSSVAPWTLAPSMNQQVLWSWAAVWWPVRFVRCSLHSLVYKLNACSFPLSSPSISDLSATFCSTKVFPFYCLHTLVSLLWVIHVWSVVCVSGDHVSRCQIWFLIGFKSNESWQNSWFDTTAASHSFILHVVTSILIFIRLFIFIRTWVKYKLTLTAVIRSKIKCLHVTASNSDIPVRELIWVSVTETSVYTCRGIWTLRCRFSNWC